MKASRFVVALVMGLAVVGSSTGSFAADIDDLQRCYFGNHWSLVTPQLEPQAGIFIVTSKHGENFTATLEKVGGHNGARIVASGSGKVKSDGSLTWTGFVSSSTGAKLIKVSFSGVLSVTGKAIGGGPFTAKGAFEDGFAIDDQSFYQWETPCPFSLPPA
jgi:hypothetical protein